jgi:ADP-ribose pyrophosphatase YjhB (NUDIX family)
MVNEIRVRVALAVVQAGRILLVPHYHTDAGFVQWTIPGGKVEFGESLSAAAVREFFEETGLQVEVVDLLDVTDVILEDRPYHSITITYTGRIVGGEERPEANHPYGAKPPKWFRAEELADLQYHPKKTVDKAFLYSAKKSIQNAPSKAIL